jgi:hypothetical protein
MCLALKGSKSIVAVTLSLFSFLMALVHIKSRDEINEVSGFAITKGAKAMGVKIREKPKEVANGDE